jgi:hypothetical protein
MTASATYTPRAVPRAAVAKGTCRLRVLEIQDDRMDPSVLGSVAGRTVHAPTDAQAWLRSVIAGLDRSGILVEFAPDAAPGIADLDARAELNTAWVSSATTAKTASVVLYLQLLRADQLVKTADYRGSISSPNWSSTQDEIQRMIDRAFDQVIAEAASDIRSVCLGSS